MSSVRVVASPSRRLPDGWCLARSEDLFSFITSGSRGWARFYAAQGAPFIRIGDLTRGTLSVAWTTAQRVAPPETSEGTRTRLRPGDILISITADLGVVGVVPERAPDSYVNQHVALARPRPGIEPRFLGWFLDAEVGGQLQFREFRRGATKAGLGLDDIRAVSVPLAPRTEQRRVVAEIEKHFTRLDEAVATLKAVQAKLKRARASVLKAAVEGRLVPTEVALARAEGRSYEPASALLARILAERRTRWPKGRKYQPPAEPNAHDLPMLPEGWAWASVEQLTDPVRVVRYGILKPGPDLAPGGLPYIKVKHMRGNTIVPLAALPRTSEQIYAQYAGAVLQANDLLISIRGTYGRVALVRPDLDGANITQDSARIAPLAFVDRHYLRIALLSERSQSHFKRVARGVGVRGINIADLRPTPVPVPPADEQPRIAAEVERRLSVIDNLERTVEQNLARCGRLRQSILKRAFEGNLVPQDPADEPASVLLARIRAQRAAEAHA